jgi:hypothetical protein
MVPPEKKYLAAGAPRCCEPMAASTKMATQDQRPAGGQTASQHHRYMWVDEIKVGGLD